MLVHRYVKPAQALALVETMPLDDAAQRRLKAAVRRWVKTVREQGHDVPEA